MSIMNDRFNQWSFIIEYRKQLHTTKHHTSFSIATTLIAHIVFHGTAALWQAFRSAAYSKPSMQNHQYTHKSSLGISFREVENQGWK